jgi:hypothetical protein
MVQPALTVAKGKAIVGAPGEVVRNVIAANAISVARIEIVLYD